MVNRASRRAAAYATCALGLIGWGPQRSAVADEAAQGGLEEVIVTARKREESVMKTPVDITVVTQQQLKDLKIQNLYDLAETVSPDLRISYGFGAVGTVLYVRGIGSGDSASYVDQSVALNIDGVTMSHGIYYKAGSFDMSQIDVLKGPQGLFYGKSTTAGIIVLHTADPTRDWQSEVSTGYEFNAREVQTNAFLSGPITDELLVRLAGFYDTDRGWLYNPNNDDPALPRWYPNGESYGGRITLLWDDSDAGLRAKLKFGTISEYTRGNSSTMNQGFGCPTGVRQNLLIQPYDNCRLDKYTQGFGTSPPYNPNVDWENTLGTAALSTGSASPLMGDGRPYTKTKTVNTALQVDYDVAHDLTLTSVTGWSWADTIDTAHSGFGLDTPFDLGGEFAEDDYSEELRLTSNWKDSWFNFMLGALYAPSRSSNTEYAALPTFTSWGTEYAVMKSSVTSAFTQLLFAPSTQWEIAPGVRFTHVKKYFDNLQVFNNFGIPGNTGVNQVGLLPSNQTGIAENNVSPELTVTYRPADQWTVYGSYKRGYKGPGFNWQDFATASYNPAIVPNTVSPFGGEKVQGGELGLKVSLLDRSLALTLSPYWYKYKQLQVSNYNYTTNVIEVTNGADAITYGAELGANYRVAAIPQLQFNSQLAYNHATFSAFPASPCWGGQTAAQGCITSTGGAQVQDLKGHTLVKAPRWAGSVGANYTQPLKNHYLGGSVSASFSSGYFTVPDLLPSSWQSGWLTLDAALRFGQADQAWEVALIARNLTNKLYVTGASDGGTITPGVMADAFGYSNRARQVLLTVTLHPEKFMRH